MNLNSLLTCFGFIHLATYHISNAIRLYGWYYTVVYQHTNISGIIIKHNLRTSMNKQTHFFIKMYLSHFILERVDVSVVCERWLERHILSERTSSSYIFYQEPGGSDACTPLKARRRRLWSAACPSLDCDSLHSVQI